MSEEIKEKLLAALPHFRYAMKQAAAKGRAQIGILATQPDGTGNIIAHFDAPEFFDDIATLIGAPPQTEDDDLDARATEFVQKAGLSGLVQSDSGGPK